MGRIAMSKKRCISFMVVLFCGKEGEQELEQVG